METSRPSRKPLAAIALLLLCALSCMTCLTMLTVTTLRTLARQQKSHLQSFVPAKRLTAGFEREILNARIFFIYFVTIQKPGSKQQGWARYRNAEARLHDLAQTAEQHPELENLRYPVRKLRSDLASYNEALSTTLAMVESGEKTGPHYDAQVKEWAARGAVLVTDAATVEALCFNSGEANTAASVNAVRNAQSETLLLFCASILLCLLTATGLLRWQKQGFGSGFSAKSADASATDGIRILEWNPAALQRDV